MKGVNTLEIINLYQGFKEIYNEKLSKKQLVEAWYQFMDEHKLVRDMCIRDYEKENLDWKQVAYDRVFFYDADYVQKMNETVKLLETITLTMKNRLHMFNGTESIDAIVILYHGLGNGAGWISTYENKPAIYLGIEKIVELGWNTKRKLEDLLSHEYGH